MAFLQVFQHLVGPVQNRSGHSCQFSHVYPKAVLAPTGNQLSEENHIVLQFPYRNIEILDAIKAIERFGLRMEPGPDGVTMADMQGQPLMSNREGGRISVPKVAL